MPDVGELRTERLLLRHFHPADRVPFAAMNADAAVMRYFPRPLTRAESDALVDYIDSVFASRGYGCWALERLDTGEFIGFTGLNPLPAGVPGAGGVEVGWRLAQPAWHRGFATEAARAAVRIAFTEAGLDAVWSMTAVPNTPSQAVMHRLGMARFAEFDHPRLSAGSWLRRHVMYRLTAAEWRAGVTGPAGAAGAEGSGGAGPGGAGPGGGAGRGGGADRR